MEATSWRFDLRDKIMFFLSFAKLVLGRMSRQLNFKVAKL
jgi:hypothetical protein